MMLMIAEMVIPLKIRANMRETERMTNPKSSVS